MGKPRITVSLSALAAALLMPAVARAQDAPSPAPAPATTGNAQTAPADNGGIPDIVVTAQRRSENIQTVPIAISAFTTEALKERAIGDVSALSGITPNVTLDASTPFSGSSAVLGATIIVAESHNGHSQSGCRRSRRGGSSR